MKGDRGARSPKYAHDEALYITDKCLCYTWTDNTCIACSRLLADGLGEIRTRNVTMMMMMMMLMIQNMTWPLSGLLLYSSGRGGSGHSTSFTSLCTISGIAWEMSEFSPFPDHNSSLHLLCTLQRQLSSWVASAMWTEFATSSRRLPTDSVDNLETDVTKQTP